MIDRPAFPIRLLLCLILLLLGLMLVRDVRAESEIPADASVARQWNEETLAAIRRDFARPTVHARNLFHVSAAAWDAWAAYDSTARGWLVLEKQDAEDIRAARETAISHAAYRILRWRFRASPGAPVTLRALDERFRQLGLDPDFTTLDGDSPAALGNRIAAAYLALGEQDNANEADDFGNRFYESVNPPLVMNEPGNPNLVDPNRYQPLQLPFFLDQAGNPVSSGCPEFLSPEWGQVTAFALDAADLEIVHRNGFDYWTFHDPGPPPRLGGPGDQAYKNGFAQVVEFSGLLDPAQGESIDISPASNGAGPLAFAGVQGHPFNPATGAPYAEQVVPAGDYYRVLAEFWADGPDSETPPGHWFTIANGVSDHPALERRIAGQDTLVDPLEWDVKLHFALGGAMHDAAVAAWGVKGKYDYIRPVSAIRAMADLGQSTDPAGPSYHPDGIPLRPGRIEVITPSSARPGERHAHLVGEQLEHLGKIAVYAWRGPDFIGDPAEDVAGVGWIRAENWWPYQRPSFVTPPFAGYVSGHSTYSRAAAELLEAFTGSAYFPGGIGEFPAPANEFLVFEDGPSVDITLQWATYRDAADESGLSRIYGGIHPTADDIPGRLMGAVIGLEALRKAATHFSGRPVGAIERAPLLPTASAEGIGVFSGSWAVRGREGEGWSIIARNDESAVVHWLTYDEHGAARWLQGLATRSGNVLAGRFVTFSLDDDGDGEAWGSFAFTLRDCDSARIDLRPDAAPFRNAQRVARRVNGLDGLPCKPGNGRTPGPQAGQSGFWTSEEGPPGALLLHMVTENRGLAYELAFDEHGQPTWLLGTGGLERGDTLRLERFEPSGLRPGEALDPDDLLLSPLPDLELRFLDCGSALGSSPATGEQLTLQRSLAPPGLACP